MYHRWDWSHGRNGKDISQWLSSDWGFQQGKHLGVYSVMLAVGFVTCFGVFGSS